MEREYYFSAHTEEEMSEDHLERIDVENAILKGTIEKKLTRDARGTRYRIGGPAEDGRQIHVLCGFMGPNGLLIITVYAVGGMT